MAEHVDDLGFGVVRVEADVEEGVGAGADEGLAAADDFNRSSCAFFRRLDAAGAR